MTDRIYSLDAMRIVAMAFVVLLHTDPFAGAGAGGNAVNFLIETTARFAVPFFFLTSGYFFALKTADRDPLAYFRRRAASIGALYLFGMTLAAPIFLIGTAIEAALGGDSVGRAVVGRLGEFLAPGDLLYYGTSVSDILWFLPALLVSLAFVAAFRLTGRTRLMLIVAVAIHVVGILGSSYTMLVDVPFRVRDGLFFGVFYTAVGYAIAAEGWRPAPDRSGRYLAATAVVGVLHVAERYVLGYALAGRTVTDGVYTPSYTVGTALVSVSLFLFLLSRPTLGERTPLPAWGAYAVGIYVAHPPVLAALEVAAGAMAAVSPLAAGMFWHLLATPLTFFGALWLYLAADRRGVIEIGGSHVPRWDRLLSR